MFAYLLVLILLVLISGYVPARKASAQAYIRLQLARKRKITLARESWDAAHNKQSAFALGALLCLIALVLTVFLPGVDSIVDVLPLIPAAVMAGVMAVTAALYHYKEQNQCN